MNSVAYFKKVWLCDDDEDDHLVFEEALCQALPNAQLTTFSNGNEVLLEFQYSLPDILFLDINMPMVNGIETLRKIRANNTLKELPVIMYSVSTQPSDINITYDQGAMLYLVKPQLFQDLVAQLKAIFTLDWKNPESLAGYRYNGEKFIPFNPTL